MARTALTVQTINRSGIAPAYTAAPVDGHSIQNSGLEFLHVKNAHTASINVTFQTPGTVDGQAVADRVVVVPNATERMIGPFAPGDYNQPGTAELWIDFSVVTAITVAAFRI